MICYIAGPYNAPTHEGISDNIQAAREVAIQLWEMGHVPLCPHLNSAHMEVDCEVPDKFYLDGDLQLQARCDCIVMLSKWKESRGAIAEHEYALQMGQPVFYYPDLPMRHPTEILRPEQCRAFIETVMGMYRTHLKKNADYSPANILATGEIGVVVRLWDKIARLLNLTGFRVEIASSTFDKPLEPNNESIADTALDAAVYAVIYGIHQQGKWGK